MVNIRSHAAVGPQALLDHLASAGCVAVSLPERLVAFIDMSQLIRDCIASLAKGAASVGYATLEDLSASSSAERVAVVVYRLDGINHSAHAASIRNYASNRPGVAIVLLVQDVSPTIRELVKSAGVIGVLSSRMTHGQVALELSRLQDGIDSSFRGRPFIHEADDPLTAVLTRRQIHVLDLVERGETNKSIAYHLDLREHTVKAHLRAILSRLKAHTRQEAVHKAVALRRRVGLS